jgi:hypothetical protein
MVYSKYKFYKEIKKNLMVLGWQVSCKVFQAVKCNTLVTGIELWTPCWRSPHCLWPPEKLLWGYYVMRYDYICRYCSCWMHACSCSSLYVAGNLLLRLGPWLTRLPEFMYNPSKNKGTVQTTCAFRMFHLWWDILHKFLFGRVQTLIGIVSFSIGTRVL